MCRFRGEVAHLADVEPQRREVRIADEGADGRHQDVVHERRYDFAERAADDHADGHVHYVAFEGKLFEFFKKSHICQNLCYDIESKNTIVTPLITPGRDSFKITFVNVLIFPAPRSPAASTKE
mgnify:CR=1 FL=1